MGDQNNYATHFANRNWLKHIIHIGGMCHLDLYWVINHSASLSGAHISAPRRCSESRAAASASPRLIVPRCASEFTKYYIRIFGSHHISAARSVRFRGESTRALYDDGIYTLGGPRGVRPDRRLGMCPRQIIIIYLNMCNTRSLCDWASSMRRPHTRAN